MTEPNEVTFSAQLRGRPLWPIGAVVGAGLALLISAALTMGASPAPSGSPPPAGQQIPGGTGGWQSGGRSLEGGEIGGHRFGGACFGQITIAAINGSNLALTSADGWTRTITVTDATTITKGGQKIGLSDLKVGDAIRFRQTRNSDSSYTITAIEVVVPRVGGTVTAVTGSGFTMKSRDGTAWTITVSGSTAYALGPKTGAKSDVTVGVDVVVEGLQGSGNALTALTVHITLPRVVGEVTAKSADTITVQRRDGTTATIHVGSATTYHVPGIASPSLSDITVGMPIAAEGTQRTDGSLDAVAVYAKPHWGRGFPGWRWGPGASPSPGSQG